MQETFRTRIFSYIVVLFSTCSELLTYNVGITEIKNHNLNILIDHIKTWNLIFPGSKWN